MHYNGESETFTQGIPWYQVYVDYAITNGIVNANDFTEYDRSATRAEMAYIFSTQYRPHLSHLSHRPHALAI